MTGTDKRSAAAILMQLMEPGRRAVAGEYGKTRARRSSKPARPYIWRLIVLRRLIWPSTWPVLHEVSTAAATAEMSFCQAVGEADHRAELTVLGALDPLPQLGRLTCRQGSAESECDLAEVDDFWTLRRDAVKEPPLLVGHLIGWASHKDGGMLG